MSSPNLVELCYIKPLHLLIVYSRKLYPNLKILNFGSYNDLLEIEKKLCNGVPIVLGILSRLCYTITFILYLPIVYSRKLYQNLVLFSKALSKSKDSESRFIL